MISVEYDRWWWLIHGVMPSVLVVCSVSCGAFVYQLIDINSDVTCAPMQSSREQLTPRCAIFAEGRPIQATEVGLMAKKSYSVESVQEWPAPLAT